MAANVAAGAELVSTDEGGETITDIQNYLQSFNKEIGEAGGGEGTAFFIDASQLPGDVASGTPTTVAATGASGEGYQTVALVPDGSNGGYVLIVQPTAGQGQVQLPVAAGNQVLTTVVEKENAPSTPATRSSTRVKKSAAATAAAAVDEKPNDISVYDFDDGKFEPTR